MKRKYLVLASCIISALLLMFPLRLHADENVTVDAGASSNTAPLLDSYFWENYYLLPYVESTNGQYLISNIVPSYDTRIECRFALDHYNDNSNLNYVFGSYSSTDGELFGASYSFVNGRYQLYVSNQYMGNYIAVVDPNRILNVKFEESDIYVDGTSVYDGVTQYSYSTPIALFARNDVGTVTNKSYARIYNISSYDLTEDEYTHYYYPAKSKSSSIVGFYDAVTRNFYQATGSNPFVSPTDENVIHFQIGDFIESGLGWIGDILEFAIEEPMILMFMAIGLCGVAFRWARRVVHF